MKNVTEIIKDLATIFATITAGIVAIKGLSAWKKQLKGKTDYELARRYLRAVYKVRDAIKYVRNPFISLDEMESARKTKNLEESANSDKQTTDWAVYTLRWEKIFEALSDLDVELIEAEVSWGKTARDIEKSLDKRVRELRTEITKFVSGWANHKTDMIIYDAGEEDEFTAKINTAIGEIETYLQPHLK